MNLAALALALAQSGTPAPQADALELGLQRFEVVAGSSTIGFDGASTLHDFSGKASRLGGELRVDPRAVESTAGGLVWIETASLDTGNKSRDSDMRESLQAKRYARIGFVLESASGTLDGWTGHLRARGRFVIAGEERERSFPFVVEPAGAGFRAKGDVRFKMSEHGIEPPSVLFIDVDDEVKVFFDLVLRRIEAPMVAAHVCAMNVREDSGAGAPIERSERFWWCERGALWEQSPWWVVASDTRATRIDVRTALDAGAPDPIEPRFEELRKKLAQPGALRADERAALERALQGAPAAGEAQVERGDHVLSIRLGGVEWIRFEGSSGSGDFARACAALEGLPSAVALALRDVRGVPERATLRLATPEATRTLSLRFEPERAGRLPEWAVAPESWTHARKP